jgi:hypothetical protein
VPTNGSVGVMVVELHAARTKKGIARRTMRTLSAGGVPLTRARRVVANASPNQTDVTNRDGDAYAADSTGSASCYARLSAKDDGVLRPDAQPCRSLGPPEDAWRPAGPSGRSRAARSGRSPAFRRAVCLRISARFARQRRWTREARPKRRPCPTMSPR